MIQFKGQKLTRTKCKNNILNIWEQCTQEEKFDWYQSANYWATMNCIEWVKFGQVERESKLIPKMYGVIAALSPLKTWEQNKKLAEQMMLTKKPVGHTQLCNKKALAILDSDGSDEQILDILNGNKISAFYLNIKYPSDGRFITVDRHALSCLLGYWVTDEDYKGITKNQYEFFVQTFQWTAKKLGVNPLVLQSATWVRFRKIKNNYKK